MSEYWNFTAALFVGVFLSLSGEMWGWLIGAAILALVNLVYVLSKKLEEINDTLKKLVKEEGKVKEDGN